MSTEKRKLTRMITPKGKAFYAHLRKPETWEGKEVGYTIQLKLNKEDTDALIEAIDAELENAKETIKLKPGQKWSVEPMLGYKEDKEGDIIFKFKASTTIKMKTGEVIPRTIPVFDAQGNPIEGNNIGNGSIVKVAFALVPFWVSKVVNGVSLRLEAVQVLDLVEFGKGNAESYGFGAEEGYIEDKHEKIVEEEASAAEGDF